MILTEAREAIAAALSGVGGLNVRSRPIPQPRTGDGWVVITRLAPSTFSASSATFTAVVILGPDAAKAEEKYEEYGVPIIDAITANLNAADVSLEAQVLVTGNNASPVYGLALTLTLEVS